MKIVSLKTDAPGKYSVDLETTSVELRTRYSYLAECWTLDIADAQGEALITGLMLVPDIDLLKGYPELKETLGSLLLVERLRDEYKSPDALGLNTKLLWYAPGEEVEELS